jgi:hypothetical protein
MVWEYEGAAPTFPRYRTRHGIGRVSFSGVTVHQAPVRRFSSEELNR